MAVEFEHRNIFEGFFAIKILILICLFSGCSQKAIYFFSPPQTQISLPSKTDSIAGIKTVSIEDSKKPSEIINFSAKRSKIKTFETNANEKIASSISQTSYLNSYTTYENQFQLFPGSSSGPKSLRVTQDKVQDIQLKLFNARERFPVPLFIVLSLILAGLISLYLYLESSDPQGPSIEVLLLFPIIPLAVVWLFLAFKGLGILVAPLLGWPVFWTSIALVFVALVLLVAIILLVDFIRGFLNKIKQRRFEKKKSQS